MTPYLTFENVQFNYPDGRAALKGLSLNVSRGCTGLVGANGAGKSTLLKLIVGLLKPSAGEILLEGCAVIPSSYAEVRRRIGLAFQDPDDQLFMSTVEEDVAFGPRNAGLAPDAVRRLVDECLGRVGALHLKDRMPWHLSGGEKRLAALAAVLSSDPELLILDEPSAGLDPAARRRLIHLLQRMPGYKLVTSHDLDLILETCTEVIILNEGTVAAQGPVRELLQDTALLERCGLELPLQLQGCPICNPGGKS